MALIHSFEKSGNVLFRYRGQIPVFLFIAAIPVLYFTDTSTWDKSTLLVLTWVSILLSFLGFIIRAWAIGTTPKGTSGRNTRAGQVAEVLNTTGIYSVVRHPLYLGNYFMWTGIVLFTFNFWFVAVVSLAYWLYYERIMFAEERFLERKFGKEYLDWAGSVPAFLPAFRIYVRNRVPFSMRSILRREYSGFLATVVGFAFIDHLRYYFGNGTFELNRASSWVLAFSILVTLLLRTLKHQTRLLHEIDRS